ncbi:MAG: hypothetical protein HY617_00795 [Candidatus Sungbacteria bacterium]|nr:hypothetical protein [Candidatus Sungbacteria bacterium]
MKILTKVEVNNGLIFRFPKDEEADFGVEVKVLDALRGKISVGIGKWRDEMDLFLRITRKKSKYPLLKG